MVFEQKKFKETVKEYLREKSFHQLDRFLYFTTIITLINLTELSKAQVKNIWQTDGLKHSYHIFTAPLVMIDLAKAAVNSSPNDNLRLHQKSINVAATTSGKVHLAEQYVLLTANEHSKKCITAISSTMRAVSFAITGGHISLVCAPLADVVKHLTEIGVIPNNAELIDALWQTIVLQNPTVVNTVYHSFLAPCFTIINSIRSFEIGVEKIKDDLVILTKALFSTSDIRTAIEKIDSNRYTLNYNDAEFLSESDLRDILEKRVYPVLSRTLILGSGGAGKTTLFNLMKNSQVQENYVSSTTINIHDIDNCQQQWFSDNDVSKPLKMSIWDFAGQSQYYGLHQSFFCNGCIFVVMTDSRHQQSIYEWLYQISILTGDASKTKVVIFVNIYENCPSQINVPDLQVRFPKLEISERVIFRLKLDDFICRFNRNNVKTIDDESIRPFLDKLIQISEDNQTYVGERHYNLYQKVKACLEKEYYIRQETLKEIAEDTQNLTNYHQLVERFGLLINQSPNKEGHWLSAGWLNDSGYNFLHTLRTHKGHQHSYSKEDLHSILSQRGTTNHYIEQYEKLLDHFYQTNLAVKIDDKIIIPALLPHDDPLFLKALHRGEFERPGKFIIHLEYMQFELFSQLIAIWLKNTYEYKNNLIQISIDDDHYSRNCCILSGMSISKDDAFYIVVKWHPNFCQLTFEFYCNSRLSDSKEKTLNYFRDILTHLLQSIENNNKQLVWNQNESSLKEHTSNKKFKLNLSNLLSKSIEAGRLYINIETLSVENMAIINKSSVFGDVTQGDIKVNNVKGNSGNIALGHKAMHVYTSDSSSKNSYNEALDILYKKFLEEKNTMSFNSENFESSVKRAIEKAKEDLANNNLNEEKQGFFSKLCEAMKKAGNVSSYILSLIKIWNSV